MLPMPTPPAFKAEIPPLTLGPTLWSSSKNRWRYTKQKKALYWLFVIVFSILWAIMAYEIVTTEAFLKSH